MEGIETTDGDRIHVTSATTKNVKMASVLRQCFYSKREIRLFNLTKRARFGSKCFCTNVSTEEDNDGFRVLELYPKQEQTRRIGREKRPANPPRTKDMTPDFDWTNEWTGPRTFHPASVPLPIRQGCNKHGPPPDKYANTELMKIPNFLHLTPPAIEKQCQALKKFCTKWPENLKTEEDIEEHFPVEIITSDYCHSSCSIRDPKARVVSLRIKMKHLEFDEHSKDKFLRIVGPRFNPTTGYITITTDSCPIKKQNYDYTYYLLTAVYFEAWKLEDWENTKSDDDMETYIFSQRESSKSAKAVFDYNKRETPNMEELGKSIESWVNKGETKDAISEYKKAVMKLLSLPPLEASS